MPAEIDFSSGTRGKFYRENARPVCALQMCSHYLIDSVTARRQGKNPGIQLAQAGPIPYEGLRNGALLSTEKQRETQWAQVAARREPIQDRTIFTGFVLDYW
jgi:hypothetical protein